MFYLLTYFRLKLNFLHFLFFFLTRARLLVLGLVFCVFVCWHFVFCVYFFLMQLTGKTRLYHMSSGTTNVLVHSGSFVYTLSDAAALENVAR